MQNRMISTELVEEDIKIENHLRPQMLSDYIGQEKVTFVSSFDSKFNRKICNYFCIYHRNLLS